ncbi:MAG: Serine carboxypeptidase [Bacteroidetes bacterium]|nr:Serine carboxypeptidase [Bacteroidota bacterium]
MDTFKVISFTHKNLPLELLGKLHLSPEEQTTLLGALKINFELDELMYLSTCNRVELLVNTNSEISRVLIKELCLFINSRLTNFDVDTLTENAEVYYEMDGVEHVLKVASSLDSLVVGEREIITQVRKAYDFCNMLGLTRDFLRLLVKQTIETAKEVYTNTDIARNPVSVVSLAYRKLREQGMRTDSRIVFVGSGETNAAMANYLQKHKFANFTVFNRTLENAEKLAKVLKGKALPLTELTNFDKGFDVLVVCTSSNKHVITKEVFEKLNQGEISKKIIIDLSLPSNVDETILETNKKIVLININSLKEQAETNMQLRKKEVDKCEQIIRSKAEEFNWLHKERRIELAFGEIPKQVKAIKELAINEVFVKEINSLDDQSKEVLDKVLAYVEKKYNAVAIKTAKNVLLNSKD